MSTCTCNIFRDGEPSYTQQMISPSSYISNNLHLLRSNNIVMEYNKSGMGREATEENATKVSE